MFSSLKSFLHRHRRKFIVTGAVFGGLYLLTSYAQKKLREWQEKEAKKFFEMTRKKQHFESTERTCNQTILSLSKIVSESIMSILNTEEIDDKLREFITRLNVPNSRALSCTLSALMSLICSCICHHNSENKWLDFPHKRFDTY